MTGSEEFLSGLPVSVDPERIDRELSRFWKPESSEADRAGSRAVTRACLANLVVHGGEAGSRRRVADLVADLGRRFPSRMILLTCGDPPRSAGPPLSAWITAVCHRPRPGSAVVCCEQITLEARSKDVASFQGAVMPLLVPDVPVILVLLGGGGERLASVLGGVTDRIVADSRGQGRAALELLAPRIERDCTTVDDLAWHATVSWRRVLADLFDEAPVRALAGSLDRVVVEFEPGDVTAPDGGDLEAGAEPPGWTPAALLGGWLLTRLGWSVAGGHDEPGGLAATFRRGDRRLRAVLKATSSAGPRRPGRIVKLRLATGEGCGLEVSVEGDAAFRILSSTSLECILPRTVGYRQADGDGDLLAGALQRVTHQGVLGAAIRASLGFRAGRAGKEHS